MRWVLVQFHLLVLVFSFTGILGEIISVGTPALVFWRTLLASAAYFLWVRWRTPERLRAGHGRRWQIFLNGVVLGVHWICFFGAIALSNVSVGLAGFASTSLFTALAEPISERRRLRASEVGLGVVVLAGLVVLALGAAPGGFGGFAGDGSRPLLGLLVALVGALLAAVYSVVNRRFLLAGIPSTSILVFGMPGAFVAAAVAIAVVPGFAFEVPAAADWPPLLVLALGCTFLAYIWYTNLMRHLTAYTANMIVNFEPVYGILMASLLFGEHKDLSLTFYLGLGIIVLANILHARAGSKPAVSPATG